MDPISHWAALGQGVGGIILTSIGYHLLAVYRAVRRGKSSRDCALFRAIARGPYGDFGEWWKHKDNPDLAAIVGGFLLCGGLGQIFGCACYFWWIMTESQ